MKKSLLSLIMLCSFILVGSDEKTKEIDLSTSVPNLVINGSFEEEGTLYNKKGVLENGFKVVDNKWAKGWRIGVSSEPGTFCFIEEKAADGKRYLRVKTTGPTTIYMADAITADKAYKCSFSAKGEDFEGKSATISVYAYLYKKDDTFVKSNRLATFTLEDDWEVFSFEMPAHKPCAERV